jgi:hypothetical protein
VRTQPDYAWEMAMGKVRPGNHLIGPEPLANLNAFSPGIDVSHGVPDAGVTGIVEGETRGYFARHSPAALLTSLPLM